MSTLTYALTDSLTMLRRNLRRARRYPVSAASAVGVPLVLLLLFVFVFGDTMGAGLTGVAGGRDEYLDYIVPAMLIIAIMGAAQGAAISVSMDMTEGIIDRFRTMPIARVSVLTGHVVANLLQTFAAIVVVLGVALVLGFDPTATALEWVAVLALLALISLAVIWLSIALGLVSDSVETASNLPMPLFLLPFLGSGFVPAESLPAGMSWFAEHQPFTPMMETVRGLLLGTPIGDSAILAVAWSVAIALAGRIWAKRLFDRDPTR